MLEKREYLIKSRILILMLGMSLLMVIALYMLPPLPVNAGNFWQEFTCLPHGCGLGRPGFAYRWCCDACSPPCGNWFVVFCDCPI